MPRDALELGVARPVDEDEHVRRAPVVEPERDAGELRVDDRPLALDEEQVAALGALDDEALAGAGEEVRDDGVHGDAPAGDHDPRLPGRDEHRAEAARAGGPVELDRDGLLAHGAVGAHREHDLRREREVLPGRDAQVGRRAAVVTKLDPVLARERGELGVVREELVHPRLDVQPGLDGLAEDSAPDRGEPPAGHGDADERDRRLVDEGVRDRADDGMPSIVSPARVESSTATTGSGA